MDVNRAIEIAPRVWWVGYVIPDDPFQCHVYLIENGSESILIDPGSKLTWEVTRKKIEEVIDLEDIRYIICHHQDPDIVSCIGDLLKEIGTKDRFIITHWRTVALLKHYDWGIDFYRVDEHDWKLEAADVELEFIFTPYMHFPGAFCTYDKKRKILFSSDIFGAFTPKFSLYATDAKEYFEQMKPFHQHYMPSREIVAHGLDAMAKYDIELIAPQHGSIIPKSMINYIFKKLRELDVGLFLEFVGIKDVKKLSAAHDVLSSLFEEVIFAQESLYSKIGTILRQLRAVLPITRLVCGALSDERVVIFDSALSFAYELEMDNEEFFAYLRELHKKDRLFFDTKLFERYDLEEEYQIYHFRAYNEQHSTIGLCFVLFERDEILDKEDLEILRSFQKIFNAMLLKELQYYDMQKEKKELLEKIILDAVTEVYNRYYLDEILPKEFQKAKRHGYSLSVVMIDIDRFKSINDTYGHNVGDMVLKDFAKFLKTNIREGDFLFRYGGEEFVVLMPFASAKDAKSVMERILQRLQKKELSIGGLQIVYTFSAGVCDSLCALSAQEALHKADEALYLAKRGGRARVEVCR